MTTECEERKPVLKAVLNERKFPEAHQAYTKCGKMARNIMKAPLPGRSILVWWLGGFGHILWKRNTVSARKSIRHVVFYCNAVAEKWKLNEQLAVFRLGTM